MYVQISSQPIIRILRRTTFGSKSTSGPVELQAEHTTRRCYVQWNDVRLHAAVGASRFAVLWFSLLNASWLTGLCVCTTLFVASYRSIPHFTLRYSEGVVKRGIVLFNVILIVCGVFAQLMHRTNTDTRFVNRAVLESFSMESIRGKESINSSCMRSET